MFTDLALPVGTLIGFLLVLARVAGALAFVPLPGFSAAPGPAKIAIALGLTLALAAQWPVYTAAPNAGLLAGWVVAEASVGIALGITALLSIEALTYAAQVLGLQAGYAYAQTIDPNTQADSGILLVLAQLVGGLFFFALGLDRQTLRLFALSLQRIPPGEWVFGRFSAEILIRLVSGVFSVGARLALPVIALLVMIDVSLALLGRLNSQLQLLSLAFPIKMLVALLILSWMASMFPRVMAALASQSWTGAVRMLGL